MTLDELPPAGQQAVAYLCRGWRPVVLHGLKDGGCTCHRADECTSPGKHPRLTAWQQKQPDTQQVAEWWQRWPDSNVGIQLGPASGVVDVEFDDDEGKATAERLLEGLQTPTWESDRSVHRLFGFPERLSIDKAVAKVQGLELRFGTEAKGAQSVMPPSRHASGAEYRWLLNPREVLPLPDSLLELIAHSNSNGNGQLTFTCQGDEGDLATHPGARQGERNQTLCRLAGRYIAQHGIDAELLQQAVAWGQRCQPAYPTDEVAKTITGLAGRHQSKTNGQPAAKPVVLSLSSRPFSKIESKPVEWLWQDRFALGKLSLVVGQPGKGKTLVACDMSATVSRGDAFPDGSLPPSGEAAILTAEDGAEDTLRPRLDAAGADVARVHHIDGLRGSDGKERGFSLAEHLATLDDWLSHHSEVRLLTIDPLSAFLGRGTDSHRDADVRGVLGPLAKLAEEHAVAVLGIMHLTKQQAVGAINRVMGSIAFVAAARACWLVATDRDDENESRRQLFLQVKNNLADATGLSFVVADAADSTAKRIVWDSSPVLVSCDDIEAEGAASSLAEATAWLSSLLAEGPQPAKEIPGKAARCGIAKRTLKRAKAELKIESRREGKAWVWTLPASQPGDDRFVF